MCQTKTIHHSASADDLLLRHASTDTNANTQDAHAPHSDDEYDTDTSFITLQNPPLTDASQDASASPVEIAFSASAGAFVYQMGIAAYIQEHFDLSNCQLSGCSGGAWSAALLASETNVHKAWDVIQQAQRKVFQNKGSWYSGYGRYATVVAETCLRLWQSDPDVHLRVQKRHLSIAVTRFPSMTAERHTSWTDLDDLMKSILASAMIPFALSGKPCISHRGKWYIDGGITNFKGVNCDKYSTWSDLYYHSLQMAVDTVKSTTTAVADRWFPSLTKPVAKLIHNLLPQINSPHDAVAPRLTNGANPQSGVAECNTSGRQRLLLKPWTWRSHHVSAFHLSVDIATHQERFDMGYDDARLHHHELAALLPSLVKASQQ